MTLKGAIADLQNLIDSEGIPFWAKPSLQKVKETIEEELQKEEKTEHDDKTDLVARQILAKLSGLPVSDTARKHAQKIIFGDRPAEKGWPFTGDYFENDVLAPEAVRDKVIVVQIDCLMPMENVMAFRKELLAQMKEGIIVIPPWAHVSHVGDECKIEIKEMEEQTNDKI